MLIRWRAKEKKLTLTLLSRERSEVNESCRQNVTPARTMQFVRKDPVLSVLKGRLFSFSLFFFIFFFFLVSIWKVKLLTVVFTEQSLTPWVGLHEPEQVQSMKMCDDDELCVYSNVLRS